MAQVLGNRPAVVTRELTKLHEEVRRGMLADLAAQYGKEKEPRGELTVLVGPPKDSGVDFARADPLLDQALKFMPVRAAAELVSEALGVPRRAIYDRALERKGER
jgi:16S rRNA (cytidine1402-2'-O)-methyltransferase